MPITIRGRAGGVFLALAIAAPGDGPRASAQTITDLGALTGQNFFVPTSVSADGAVVAGTSYNGQPGGARAFRWTRADGMRPMPFPNAHSAVVSGDGSTIVGDAVLASQLQAYKWTASGGAVGLGLLPQGDSSFAVAVSASGSAVAGYDYWPGDDRAWRWTPTGGMQDLGRLPDAFHTHATGISGDGSAVVGWNLTTDGGAQAWRWTATGGLQDLSTGPGGAFAQAFGVSADGTVIVGSGTAGAGSGAVRWTASTGLTDLGVPAGFSGASAQAVSGDGLVAAGVCGAGRACYWAPGIGAVDLNAYLPTIGLDLSGWVLTEASGLNYDGSVIVGYGTLDGQDRAWIVTIPAPGAASLLICTALSSARRRRSGSSR